MMLVGVVATYALMGGIIGMIIMSALAALRYKKPHN